MVDAGHYLIASFSNHINRLQFLYKIIQERVLLSDFTRGKNPESFIHIERKYKSWDHTDHVLFRKDQLLPKNE